MDAGAVRQGAPLRVHPGVPHRPRRPAHRARSTRRRRRHSLGGEEGERLVRLGKDCRHRSSQDALASWLESGWKADVRAAEFAEQHPDEAETVRVARLTVDGVEDYRRAEREAWEAERAKAAANTPS
uniref:Uncharacterized protein n=1 Tax=Streptomyces sp. NBC_00093 TaxID=2975649 RepID=A0AAU2AGW8_9ACTN